MQNQTFEELSAHLEAAQHALERMRGDDGEEEAPLSKISSAARGRSALEKAILILQNRRARYRHFNHHEIFGEPSWDILLDLYIHQSRNENVSVKSASIASGVPATTALRWLSVLEDRGLIASEEDGFDQRRRLVRLTPQAYDLMTGYLEGIPD